MTGRHIASGTLGAMATGDDDARRRRLAIVLVVLVLLRWLLRSWLGRIFLIVAAVVIYMAASGRSIG